MWAKHVYNQVTMVLWCPTWTIYPEYVHYWIRCSSCVIVLIFFFLTVWSIKAAEWTRKRTWNTKAQSKMEGQRRKAGNGPSKWDEQGMLNCSSFDALLTVLGRRFLVCYSLTWRKKTYGRSCFFFCYAWSGWHHQIPNDF